MDRCKFSVVCRLRVKRKFRENSDLSKRSGHTTRKFATIWGSGDKYPSYPGGVAAQLGFLPRFGVLGTKSLVIQGACGRFLGQC